jgi:hypothetical protein
LPSFSRRPTRARIAKAIDQGEFAMWQDIRLGLRRFTVIAVGVFVAMAWFAGNARVHAGTAGDDAVLLDPFDPVPQIGFHHGEYGDCYDPCGERSCYHACGYHRCSRDCYRHERGCERDCRDARWDEDEALERYRHQANTYDMLLQIYSDQLHWYDWRYRDGGHGAWHDGEWRDGAWHEGHPDGDWHDTHWDGIRHDGPPDVDHHDGDHHDGDPHDGDHHDLDHHDGDTHDGPPHDGDHHDAGPPDGDHHGQWQDHDGNWHDGPPPDGYGH